MCDYPDNNWDIDEEHETVPYHLVARQRVAAEHGYAITPPASFVPPVAVEVVYPPAEWELAAEQYPEPEAEYVVTFTVAELAEALRQAKDAHTAFEREFGEPDNDWPTWYAQHILGEIAVTA